MAGQEHQHNQHNQARIALRIFQILQQAERENWARWERHAAVMRALPVQIPDPGMIATSNSQEVMQRIQATEVVASLIAHLPTHEACHAAEMRNGPAFPPRESQGESAIFPRVEAILDILPEPAGMHPGRKAERKIRACKDNGPLLQKVHMQKLDLQSAYNAAIDYRQGAMRPKGVGESMHYYLRQLRREKEREMFRAQRERKRGHPRRDHGERGVIEMMEDRPDSLNPFEMEEMQEVKIREWPKLDPETKPGKKDSKS